MTCQACAGTVERALASLPGVARAEVSFAAGQATLALAPDAEPGRLGPAAATAVRRAGYSTPGGLPGTELDEAASVRAADAEERAHLASLGRRTALAVTLGIATTASLAAELPTAVAVLLAGGALALGGRDVLRSGFGALARRAPDMNSLIGVGTLAAWLAGAVAPLLPAALGPAGPHLHAAVMILGLTLIGRWLEARARRRAGDAVRTLFTLAPPRARVLRRGEEREVPLAEVRPGNLVLVRPGERVPVDGTILQGHSSLDEALLTGESLPVERGPGDPVRAGTLNGNGALSVKAEGIGADSALGRIASAVRAAQGTRTDVQRLADRVSAIFVPCVLALALLSALGWLAAGAEPAFALGRLITVLVVACPCALGLATPAAVVVASGRGAREGCLIRDARTLERLARVDVALLDKTGTLTRGEPELTAVVTLGALAPERLLALAAAVERASEQPLARAVVRHAEERGVPRLAAEEVVAEPGRGVRGRADGHALWIGSPRTGAERGLAAPGDALADLERDGATPVLLVVDGRLEALLGFADGLRPESAPAVRRLRAQGLALHLVSGDHPAVVAAVAARLGIEEHAGGLLPEEKADYVRGLQARGRRVLMAGDGINDAVALSVAEVGVAMGGGADVAIDAADATLLTEDPSRLPLLVALARRTMGTIRANLVWAFAYNLVALPLAVGVTAPWTDFTLPPHLGAAAMAGSSLVVVLNSLRLRWARLGG